jgi:hypothetical protein
MPDTILEKDQPQGQLQPNFGGMVLGWPPSKIVSDDPDFQPRWPPSCHLGRRSEMPDTILEGDHTRIISAKFG